MRVTALVTLALLTTTLLGLVPAADARPSPVCLQDRSPCPSDVCVDSDLDGRFTYEDTCVGFLCPTWGCCGGPCPPPPAASTTPTCTPYANVGGTKQRSCVDPDAAPACGAWTEGWSQLGYYRACYGADPRDALCNETWCVQTAALPEPSWLGVCTEKRVGGAPVAVSVEYGTGVGCVGLTYTTCRLQTYPGEPSTPVWSCTTKRVL